MKLYKRMPLDQFLKLSEGIPDYEGDDLPQIQAKLEERYRKDEALLNARELALVIRDIAKTEDWRPGEGCLCDHCVAMGCAERILETIGETNE
jgi:hypothetical protein